MQSWRKLRSDICRKVRDATTMQVYIYILTNASYTSRQLMETTIEICSVLHISRGTLYRCFSRLEKAGLILRLENKIYIIDLDAANNNGNFKSAEANGRTGTRAANGFDAATAAEVGVALFYGKRNEDNKN